MGRPFHENGKAYGVELFTMVPLDVCFAELRKPDLRGQCRSQWC